MKITGREKPMPLIQAIQHPRLLLARKSASPPIQAKGGPVQNTLIRQLCRARGQHPPLPRRMQLLAVVSHRRPRHA